MFIGKHKMEEKRQMRCVHSVSAPPFVKFSVELNSCKSLSRINPLYDFLEIGELGFRRWLQYFRATAVADHWASHAMFQFGKRVSDYNLPL